MSLLLTASNLLERLKQRPATPPPTALVEPPPVESPRQLRDRLRQEIRKEVPDAKSLGHPNYTPVVPGNGL